MSHSNILGPERESSDTVTAATVTEMKATINALVTDLADVRTKMNSLLTKFKAHGLIASA